MSKTLAIFGATGQQGGSVLSHVLADPSLSRLFTIRAITRDTTSPKALSLPKSVSVVSADVNDPVSLHHALTGVHTVFAMTAAVFGPGAFDIQFTHGRNIADAAVAAGVEYIIWSTLPSVVNISGGKYKAVAPFDAKAKVEEYIRTLPIKSAFFAGASFMENFQNQAFQVLAPRPAGDGMWVMARNNSPTAKLPLIAAVPDTGKFVGAILAQPEKYEGKTLCAAEGWYSMEGIVEAMSKATGKRVRYEEISTEEFRKTLPWDGDLADVFVEGFKFYEEYDYFGPGAEEKVKWARENARGGLMGLEEFFEKNPPLLL